MTLRLLFRTIHIDNLEAVYAAEVIILAMTDNFSRYEFKFPVTFETMEQLLRDFKPFVAIDEYANPAGFYCLSSIYYDNEEKQCYHETMDGVLYRQKVRLRVYRSAGNMAKAEGLEAVHDEELSDDMNSFLELKCKYNGLVLKRRVKMKLSDSMRFIDYTNKLIDEGTVTKQDLLSQERLTELKDFKSSNVQILRELLYAIVTKRLKPESVVSYERLALYSKDDPSLRLTFDFNVRTRTDELDLRKGTGGKLSTEPDIAILEIKTGKEIPLWLSRIVAKYGYMNKTFSKYCSTFVEMLPDGPLYGAYVDSEMNGRD